MVKGINKERIFNQQREKSYLIKIILKHLELFKVEIYSYSIMSCLLYTSPSPRDCS